MCYRHRACDLASMTGVRWEGASFARPAAWRTTQAVHFSRGPKGLTIYVAPAVLLAIVALAAQLALHACQ
jgi:hypothetical protein